MLPSASATLKPIFDLFSLRTVLSNDLGHSDWSGQPAAWNSESDRTPLARAAGNVHRQWQSREDAGREGRETMEASSLPYLQAEVIDH